jgi:hypothetical protein
MRNPSTERQRELPLDTVNLAPNPERSDSESSRRIGGESTLSKQGFAGYQPRSTDARVKAERGRTLVRAMLALAVDALEKRDRNECERYTTMALRMVRDVPGRAASESSGQTTRRDRN